MSNRADTHPVKTWKTAKSAIQVTDNGDSFTVTYDGLEREIWPKSIAGFTSARDLERYLNAWK